MKIKLSYFIAISAIFMEFLPVQLSAQSEPANEYYNLNINYETISRGYTVSAFADKIKLSLIPGILSDATDVEIVSLNENLATPWQIDKISDFYQFEFRNKKAYDNTKPFYLQIAYNREDKNLKKVFYYDKGKDAWQPLPTKDFPKAKFVRALIHLPFARLAVFSYPSVLTVGQATWYNYKKGDFTASPDFPKGSKLRVYNADNNKFVDVIVNDFGPDRKQFKNRVIDLEKTAFKKIASPGAGIIDILVEPLYIPADKSGQVMGIPSGGAKVDISSQVKAAMIWDEYSGEIIWSKNSTSTLPLASLTKLIAIKVFLDTKPTLNNVVAYSVKDENYNYQYCRPGESAKLKVKDGDTMTIEDLIYASLVGSANNSIETLVRVSGLARSEFIAKMNASVADWGASTTNFIEPTGLAPENVSSAADYAIITREVFKNPIIEKVSKIPEYTFYTKNTVQKHRILNTNLLLRTNKYEISGSKTGYLDESGYCLMIRVKGDNGKSLIVVTLGAKSRDESYAETEKLINYGFSKM